MSRAIRNSLAPGTSALTKENLGRLSQLPATGGELGGGIGEFGWKKKVTQTHSVVASKVSNGKKKLNQYIVLKELGR